MIRVRDAVTLAFAKLHSRRILLALTIITSSLLFGSLYASTFVLSGVESSMQSLTTEANNGRYLVKASPVIPQDIYPSAFDLKAETIRELKSLYAENVNKAKQVAKELNIPFDEASIKPPLKPSPIKNPALPDDQQLMIDFTSPIYTEYTDKLLRQYAENAPNSKDKLKEIASKYGYSDIFSTINALTNYTNTVYQPGGKENLDYLLQNPEPHAGSQTPYGYAINSIQNSTYQMYNDSLLRNWLLPSSKGLANSDAIPVIITTKEAMNLFSGTLNMPKEPSAPTEKIEWMRTLQKKINGLRYTSCYRNSADRLLMAQALNDLSEISKNAKNPDYVIPKITYNLPTEACGSLSVKKDTRTSSEKKAEQNRIDIEKRLGTYSEPERKELEFQVVGVVDLSERNFDTPRDIEGLANNLVNNNLRAGALIPHNLYENGGAKNKYDDILFGENAKGTDSTDVYTKYGLVENVLSFSDLSSAKRFIKNEGCSENVPECKKQFRLDPFGSNYLLLDELQTTIRNILNIALPIMVTIAGIIMFFTMSRVIIDSRRETAVFRALGAKRADITAIYMTYSLLVSIIILIVSILLGITVALIVQALYGSSFTAKAHVAYGLFDSSTNFSFFGVTYELLVMYAACILALGIFATAIPLLRNVRRNPIADMREE